MKNSNSICNFTRYFDIYNKSMIVQVIFVHPFKRILTDACNNKCTYEPSPRWIFFQLESQMDLFSFLLEIGQTIMICA